MNPPSFEQKADNFVVVHDLILEKLREGRALRVSISSGSMAPLLQIGDIIEVIDARIEECVPGSIIALLKNDCSYLVHRLVRYEPNTQLIFTSADNSLITDYPSSADKFLGKVIKIRKADRTIDLGTVKGKLKNSVAPYIASIYVYTRLLKDKCVDILIRKSLHSSLVNSVGKIPYLLAEHALSYYSKKHSTLRGYITRSAATKSIVPGRSDIDAVWIAPAPAERFRLVKNLYRLAHAVPIISEPGSYSAAIFSWWLRYGGAQRLEVESWRAINSTNDLRLNRTDIHYHLSAVIGGYEAYLKLWEQLKALILSTSIYHSKEILNFQKYCIDSLRWMLILTNRITVDSFKSTRSEIAATARTFLTSESFEPFFQFLAQPLPSLSSGSSNHRFQMILDCFILLARHLEASMVQHAAAHLPGLLLAPSTITGVTTFLGGKTFSVAPQLTYNQACRQIQDHGAVGTPISQLLFSLITVIEPFAQRSIPIDTRISHPLRHALLKRDIANLAEHLSYFKTATPVPDAKDFTNHLLSLYHITQGNTADENDGAVLAQKASKEFPAIFSLYSPKRHTSVEEPVSKECIEQSERMLLAVIHNCDQFGIS